MYQLEKEICFEASHQLPHHDGKCARLHGHSWRAMIILQSEELIKNGPKRGMVIDFSVVKLACKELLEFKLDHWHLNHTLGLESPTSEAVAKYIFDALHPQLTPLLVGVRVFETCTSACEYRP